MGFTFDGRLTNGLLGAPLGSAQLRVVDGQLLVQADQLNTLFWLDPTSSGLASLASEETQGTGTVFLDAEWFSGETIPLAQTDLERVLDNAASTSETIYAYQSGLHTDAVVALAVTVGTKEYLVMSSSDGYGLRTYRLTADGLDRLQKIGDPEGTYLHGVATMATVEVGGVDYVFTAGSEDHGISAYTMSGAGWLQEQSRLGVDQFLPIDTPTQMDAFTLGGKIYVLVAAAGTSSLTLLELDSSGTLVARDQVMDELYTRFQGVQVMEVFLRSDQAYVLVAGQDDGISLFSVTPDGRLYHRETIVDDAAMGLSNIADVEVVETDGVLQVFVTSTVEAGVTQLTLDLGPEGQVLYASGATLTGTSKQDVLYAHEGGSDIDGKYGADIFIDAAGLDRFTGGGSADIFVFSADGIRDEVLDFQLSVDTVDLSAWGYVHDISGFAFQSTSNGVIISYGAESVRLYSHDGASLAAEDFTTPDLLNATHIDLSFVGTEVVGLTLEGTEGDETLVGGDHADFLYGYGGDDQLRGGAGGDVLDGGSGTDLADYSNAAAGVFAALDTPSLNTRDADGDSYISVEGLIGTPFEDELIGTDAANTIYGLASADVLRGMGGDDMLYGDGGGDWIDGGEGDDRIEGGNGADAILGRAGDDILLGGSGADNIAAHEGDDIVYGGDGDDELGGSDGNDVLYGEAGNDIIGSGPDDDFIYAGDGDDEASGGWGTDTVEGGDGNDTLAGSFGVDIVRGGAGNDDLGGGLNEDELYGGSGDDLLGGGDDDDKLWGETGNDFLGGGAGDDVMRGGTGDDTLNGGGGSDRMHGEAGADIFVFNEFTDGEADFILDFTIGEDKIRMKYVIDHFDGLTMNNVMIGDKAYGVINYADHKIRLLDIDVDDLSPDDFIFLG